MKIKGIIMPIFLALALVCGSGIVLAADTGPQTTSGTGTATITNAGPGVASLGVDDAGAWPAGIDVFQTYDFYVNVTDGNTIDDIKTIELNLYVSGNK